MLVSFYLPLHSTATSLKSYCAFLKDWRMYSALLSILSVDSYGSNEKQGTSKKTKIEPQALWVEQGNRLLQTLFLLPPGHSYLAARGTIARLSACLSTSEALGTGHLLRMNQKPLPAAKALLTSPPSLTLSSPAAYYIPIT